MTRVRLGGGRHLAGWIARMAALAAVSSPIGAQLLQDPATVVVPPPPPITDARSAFARDGEVAVADRIYPAFSAQGLKLGAFDLYPGLAIGGLFTSNVFADNGRRRSDIAVVVRPEATLRTSAGPYQLDLFARGDVRRFASHRGEDTEEGLGGAAGTVAIGALSSVTAGISYGALIDPRYASDSPVDAARPLRYDALDGFAGATIEGASTRLVLRGDLEQLRFSDAPRTGGGTLFTRDRDRTRYGGLVRLERALSPAFSLYAAGTGNRIDYRFGSGQFVRRGSSGFGAYLGTSFDVSRLIRGDVRLGYLRQVFDQPGVPAIKGLGAQAQVVFSPNQLWTMTARGESSVQDSGVPGTAGFLHQGASLRADHELRRYIIASLEGGYFEDSYRGLYRRDRLPFAEVSGTYLSRQHWNARVGYRYIARHCGCSTGVASFDDHRLSTTLTFQY